MATASELSKPDPAIIFETLNAFQRTAALKAAIELEIFTCIGAGHDTAAGIARTCGIAERGARILCDYLTIIGLLGKNEGKYALTRDTAVFLGRPSPAYIGSIAEFLVNPETIETFMNLTETLRTSGANLDKRGAMSAENPVWVTFARSMKPLMAMPADAIARMLGSERGEKWKVLDIAAGHGMFGISIAVQNPQAEIFALDSPAVLAVARENAAAAGVGSRYHLLPGSAFEVDFDAGYDLILLTNFLHHFDTPAIGSFLPKVRAALAPLGRAVTLEFIPNEDRITPPLAAAFSMTMLGQTMGGDAYTFAEYARMFESAGFSSSELKTMPMPGPESIIISHR
jgi:2-polyprenyl-3-methyl-5-hydroxy-6-metoxy-1,4-benzoquinol methylase